MTRRCVVVAWACVLLLPALAAAQAARPLHRVEFSGGGGIFGGGSLGDGDASLRANSIAPTPYRLFSADTRFGSGPFVEARAGSDLSRRISIEGRFGFNRPELRTSVSADAENAPSLTIAERIDQYVIDGGVLVMLDELRVSGLTPFAAAGAGYLRQLHEGQTLVEEGHTYYVGGGVKRWLFARNQHLVRAAGLRADARLYLLAGGAAFSDSPKPRGAISGSFFVAF